MTTGGEGGMVTTNDHDLWAKMWSYKDHGKSWDTVYNKTHPFGFKWQHEQFGTNWRMTEMQAAIGRIQLKRMAQWSKQRTKNAHQILSCLSEFPDVFRAPAPPVHLTHAWYKCYGFLCQPFGNDERNVVIQHILSENVFCAQGSCSEMYLEKAFDNTGLRPEKRLEVARHLGETSLMFQIHPTLPEQDMARTCEAIRSAASSLMKS